MSHGPWANLSPMTAERKKSLEKTADRRHRTQALVNEYLQRTGMSIADFAVRINYGQSTLRKYLKDQYHFVGHDDTLITTAILGYLEQYPVATAEEFQERIYEIGNVRAMRDVFNRALAHPQVFLLYAPPGCGKTSVSRWIISEHNKATAQAERRQHIFQVYCRVRITPLALMRRIALACGTSAAGEIDRIFQNFAWRYRGQSVVLVLDEAQHLSAECFDTVRELYDQLGVSLIFTGADDLESIFQQHEGSFERLESRVAERIRLPEVTRNEAANIVRSELKEIGGQLDRTAIEQQVQEATVEVKIDGRKHRYISLRRLIGAIRVAKELMAEAALEAVEEEATA